MTQRLAHYETDCSECYRYIARDDPVWINEEGKFCTTCAVKKGIDCPICRGSKKPQFAVCYECNQKSKSQQLKSKGAKLI